MFPPRLQIPPKWPCGSVRAPLNGQHRACPPPCTWAPLVGHVLTHGPLMSMAHARLNSGLGWCGTPPLSSGTGARRWRGNPHMGIAGFCFWHMPMSKSTSQSPIFFVFPLPGQETKSTGLCNKNYLNALFQSFKSIRKRVSTQTMW